MAPNPACRDYRFSQTSLIPAPPHPQPTPVHQVHTQHTCSRESEDTQAKEAYYSGRFEPARRHLSDWLEGEGGGGASPSSSFLQPGTLTGPRPGRVSTLGLFCGVRLRTEGGLYLAVLETVREAAALLPGRFAGVRVGAFLEGQQVGLLLLQLPLELLGLALLLQLPPLILLRAGRIRLSPKQSQRDGLFLTTRWGWVLVLPEPKVSISVGLWIGWHSGIIGLIRHLNFGSRSSNNSPRTFFFCFFLTFLV